MANVLRYGLLKVTGLSIEQCLIIQIYDELFTNQLGVYFRLHTSWSREID